MSEDNISLGRIRRLENGFEGRLERLVEHDQDAVWRVLTEPQALVQWLAPGSIELRVGGAVHIDFVDSGIKIDSTVLALKPQQLLEYSWSSGAEPERPLRWELHAEGANTRLVLTLKLPADEDIAKACAGFEAHLEMLAAALEGVSIRFPFDLFLKARQGYREMLSQ